MLYLFSGQRVYDPLFMVVVYPGECMYDVQGWNFKWLTPVKIAGG